MKPLYLTTAIPYVNAEPHIGFAYEVVLADAMARWHRLTGRSVRFLAGTDENALKNVQAAGLAGKRTQEFVDEMSQRFAGLNDLLNLSYDDFIRTTERRHITAAEKFWQACAAAKTPAGNPVIYPKTYRGLYCVGCEIFYQPEELVEGKCPEHKTQPEVVDEENYFFRLSDYTHQLATLIGSDRFQIVPETRKREMLAFIEGGLEDFSISRSKSRAKGWGIPVPGDPSQVMYVWFDALTNYLNALGESDSPLYKEWWEEGEVWHVIGKGINRFHAIYWPAMLMAAGHKLPRGLFVHGYLTIEGEKMSKSLGNVLSPYDVVKKYGADPVRYYLLREFSPFEDGDWSDEKFRARYAGDLQHGLGNLVARVTTLAEKYGAQSTEANSLGEGANVMWQKFTQAMSEWRVPEAASAIWAYIARCDQTVEQEKLWELAKKDPNRAREVLGNLCEALRHIGHAIRPFIPAQAEKIFLNLGLTVAEEHSLGYDEIVKWYAHEFSPRKGESLFPPL